MAEEEAEEEGGEAAQDVGTALLMPIMWPAPPNPPNPADMAFLLESNLELKLRWMKDSMALRAELPLSLAGGSLLLGSMMSRLWSSCPPELFPSLSPRFSPDACGDTSDAGGGAVLFFKSSLSSLSGSSTLIFFRTTSASPASSWRSWHDGSSSFIFLWFLASDSADPSPSESSSRFTDGVEPSGILGGAGFDRGEEGGDMAAGEGGMLSSDWLSPFCGEGERSRSDVLSSSVMGEGI